jgi:hypothetical protein
MAVTYSIVNRDIAGTKIQNIVDITLDASYSTGGEAVTANGCGLGTIAHLVPATTTGGYVPAWDQANSKLLMLVSEGNITTNTGVMTDLDAAASTGVALYVVPDGPGSTSASFECVNAGNADSSFKIGSTGPTVAVNDNDTPGGVVTYFDEDAANTDERWMCVSPTGQSLWVTASDGSKIKVAHNASAASAGVQVYFDDDAASAHARTLFVSPTNAAGSYTTDDAVTEQVAGDRVLAEVASTTDLALITVRCTVTGH